MTERHHVPRRALLVRLGAIGDVTNALVVAAALRRANPAMHIGWAVHPLSRPLVDGHPCVDRVHLWPRGSGLAGFRSLASEIRRENYDTALDLQRLQKSALLARRSGAQRVIGFDRKRAKELSWVWTREQIEPGPRREHMVEQYMRFPARMGLASGSPERILPSVPASVEWAATQLSELGSPPILVNLGASKPENRWPVVSFRELLEALSFELPGTPIVLTGGPGDRAVADEVARDRAVLDLVGATSLSQLWELARIARCMVAADTGPMHLCAAVGTPVIALFGPSDPARTGPYGPGHVVIGPEGVVPRDDTVSISLPYRPSGMQNVQVRPVVEATLAVAHRS